MSMRLASSLGIALSMAAGIAVVGANGAGAHEERAAGGLQFIVGWGEEPAYTGLKNSVDITVSEAGGTPVIDLRDGLKVEVSKGSEKARLTLEPAGTPGVYRAWLTPTRPGAYTFRLTGSVRGQTVDESFTSSPTTFDEVEDVSNIQFPAKDPSTGQLASRLDREVPRLSTRTDAVQAAVDEADDRVGQARTLALAGAAAGALGLVTAAAALIAARRATHRDAGRKVGPTTATLEQARSLSR